MKYRIACAILALIFFNLSCTEQTTSKPAPRPKLNTADSGIVKPTPDNPYAPIDISPMDMSYYPSDYPLLKMAHKTMGEPVMRVIYSRPHRQGRKIFGALLKYGEPWRLGANEATEIEFFQPVKIAGKTVPQGRYIIYSIPHADKWTIVLNSNLFSWGLKTDLKKDLYKFDIPIQVKPQPVEYYSMVFEKTGTGADLVMAWDEVEARLPVQFTEK
jgi:hypothetical protein